MELSPGLRSKIERFNTSLLDSINTIGESCFKFVDKNQQINDLCDQLIDIHKNLSRKQTTNSKYFKTPLIKTLNLNYCVFTSTRRLLRDFKDNFEQSDFDPDKYAEFQSDFLSLVTTFCGNEMLQLKREIDSALLREIGTHFGKLGIEEAFKRICDVCCIYVMLYKICCTLLTKLAKKGKGPRLEQLYEYMVTKAVFNASCAGKMLFGIESRKLSDVIIPTIADLSYFENACTFSALQKLVGVRATKMATFRANLLKKGYGSVVLKIITSRPIEEQNILFNKELRSLGTKGLSVKSIKSFSSIQQPSKRREWSLNYSIVPTKTNFAELPKRFVVILQSNKDTFRLLRYTSKQPHVSKLKIRNVLFLLNRGTTDIITRTEILNNLRLGKILRQACFKVHLIRKTVTDRDEAVSFKVLDLVAEKIMKLIMDQYKSVHKAGTTMKNYEIYAKVLTPIDLAGVLQDTFVEEYINVVEGALNDPQTEKAAPKSVTPKIEAQQLMAFIGETQAKKITFGKSVYDTFYKNKNVERSWIGADKFGNEMKSIVKTAIERAFPEKQGILLSELNKKTTNYRLLEKIFD